jgi:hypothetical protein
MPTNSSSGLEANPSCACCGQPRIYQCPRCGAPYCSVECYKTHSIRCASSFEEEQVRSELCSVSADLDTQNMMKDVLVKLHKQGAGGEIVWGDLIEGEEDDEVVPGVPNERLEALAKGEMQLEDLVDAEVQAIKASMLCDIQVEAWKPWWECEDVRQVRLSSDGRRLVQPVCPDDTSEEELSTLPAGPREPIPPLSSLVSKEPSDTILLHVLDVIYWYCLLMRLFNGDVELSRDQLIRVLLDHGSSMSDVKSAQKSERRYESAHSRSVDSVRAFAEGLMDGCQAAGFFTGVPARGISAGVLKDVATVFSLRRLGVLLALSEVLQTARVVKTGGIRRASVVERKVIFLLSWANERVDAIATLVSSDLIELYDETMSVVKLEAGMEEERELRLPTQGSRVLLESDQVSDQVSDQALTHVWTL